MKTTLIDKMDAICDSLASVTERMVALERERDFYKNQYRDLQHKIKSIVIDCSLPEKKEAPEYVSMTPEQMEVAKISFPKSTPQEAYQQYANNILSLRDEGRLTRGIIKERKTDIGSRINV